MLGLGGMGSAAACHLSARGKRVLGIEQYTRAHNRGSSHGESRIIRQAYYENPAYVPLLQRGYELWEQLERDTDSDLLQITGGLMIGPPGSAVVNGTIASATEHDLPYEVLDAAEVRRRYPALHPRAEDTAVFEVRAGFLRPEAAVRAHLSLAAQQGGELHFEETVQEWRAHPSGEGVEVTTGHGTYQAQHLVLAPGAWAPDLLSDIGVPFDIRRHVMCWFEPSAAAESFLPEHFPVYIWDVNGHDCFYGFPATGTLADGVKVAMHSGGDPCTAETLDRLVHDRDVKELRRYLARFIPSLNGRFLQGAACMYTLTPDEHFVLSLHPRHPQVAVAAGFSGHGFKFTSVVGEILADLATTGVTHHPIGLFAPERFAPERSPAKSFVR